MIWQAECAWLSWFLEYYFKVKKKREKSPLRTLFEHWGGLGTGWLARSETETREDKWQTMGSSTVHTLDIHTLGQRAKPERTDHELESLSKQTAQH